MMWEFIAKVVTAVISAAGGVISSYLYYKFKYKPDGGDDEEEEEDLDKHIQYSKRINSELDSILGIVEADRVWIAQFHNGKSYYPSNSNNSMKKLSVTHEITSTGISKERNTFSNMLVSFFSDMILEVSESDHVRFVASKSHESPDEIDVLFRQRGCKAMDLFGMENLDDELVGILGIDHVKGGAFELSHEEIDYLNKKANLIGGLLYYGDIEWIKGKQESL